MIGGRFIDAGGIRTWVTEAGAGPPLVLLHGASIAVEGYATFHRQMLALSRHFRTITFDQQGFGRTGLPEDGRYRDRLERVDHAVAVLEALGVREACLVGHSEGAFMAGRIAVMRPDLVIRLVLMTSGGTAPALGGALDDDWIAASRRAYDYRSFPDSPDAYVEARDLDPDEAALQRSAYVRALESGQAAMMRGLHEAGPTDYRAYVQLQERHLLPYLPKLRVPALLIWAADDATVPVARGLALLRLIPGADMHVLGGCGHALTRDRADAVTRLLSCFCGHPI